MDRTLEFSLERLKEVYEFIKLLGVGNFSKVFLVRHKFLGTELSLKILDVKGISKALQRERKANINNELEEIKNRFINEAKIIRDIKHPNIVEIDDIGVSREEEEDVGLPYFTMKFIKGITLNDKINSDSSPRMESVFKISEDILSAMNAIHERKIVCWDIRPRNIIIEEKTGRAILVNLSTRTPKDLLNETPLVDSRTISVTLPYMAPEQIRFDRSKIGPFTDIYSFGVVLYEMITSELPFKGISSDEFLHQHLNVPAPNAKKLKSDLPDGMETVIEQALAKEPSDRFQDTDIFRKALNLITKNMGYDSDLVEVMVDIGNTYEMEDCLKKDGFAKLYLVRHKGLDALCVLKIVKYGDIFEKGQKEVNDFMDQFIKEGQLLAKIKHENIVRIHDIGITRLNKIPYSIREYVEGKRLDELIKERAPFSLKEALEIAEDILPALGKLHHFPSPIIHKDIKPSNIIIEKETNNAVLIDFGIAKDKLSETKLTPTGAYPGTPEYMSPEQCNGMKNLDASTDLYSFGVVLYEMLSGKIPFESKDNRPLDVMYAHSHFTAPNIREKNPGLPPGIGNIISKSMAKEPNERYKNAGEFLHALKELKESKAKVKYQVQERTHKIHSFRYPILISFLVLISLAAIIFYPLGKKGTEKIQPEESHFNYLMGPEKESNGKKATDIHREKKSGIFDAYKSSDKKIKKYLENQDKHQNTPGNIKTAMMDTGREGYIIKVKPENNVEMQYQTYNDSFEAENIIGNLDELKQFLNANKKEMLTLDKYLEFRKKYTIPAYITFYKNELKKKDDNLPPEKYWDQSIIKNKKGYYVLEFGEKHNRHIMLYIPDKNFWIDKYEVSWLQFRTFLGAEHKGDDNLPAVVTYEDAEKYCKQYGFKLPDEVEWEYAAGKEEFTYPWGNELPDENGEWRANFESFDDGFDEIAPVNSFEKFSSPFGAVNMAGNVWEWVQGRILKGGGFFSNKENLKIKKKNVGKGGIKKGFRCIKEERENNGDG